VKRRLGLAFFLLLLCPLPGRAADPLQAIVLVAKPGLLDPNFRESVVLVTRTPGEQTVGVILNRPTEVKLGELWRDNPDAAAYAERVYFGGPVLPRAVVALFRSATPPEAPAFPVLADVYLSMHPGNIAPLLASHDSVHRLFAGFAGWSQRQLESEIARDDWYVLPAREALLFRKDTASLWRELVDQARGARAENSPLYYVHESRASNSARICSADDRLARVRAGRRDAAGRASRLPRS
jgi:putative transcriptional regulator